MCDELAFMNPEVVLQTIMPVAQQTKTCLIGTTTPQGSDNIVSFIIEAKDENDEPIIRCVRLGKPCPECLKAKRLCLHAENATAEGVSRRKRKRYASFYKHIPEVMLREYHGEIADSSSRAFKQRYIDLLRKRKKYPVYRKPELIVITIDPSGGGRSDFAIVGSYFDGGNMVIILLDAVVLSEATNEEIRSRFMSCVCAIRHHEKFISVPMVMVIENAPQLLGSMLTQYCVGMPDVITMAEYGNRQYGVPKTNDNTRAMQWMMEELLATNRIYYSVELMTCTGSSPEAMTKQLETQLDNFRWRKKERVSEFGRASWRLDGKIGGSNDDLAVAVLMAPYWHRTFYISDNPSYEPVKQLIWNREENIGFGGFEAQRGVGILPGAVTSKQLYNPNKRIHGTQSFVKVI